MPPRQRRSEKKDEPSRSDQQLIALIAAALLIGASAKATAASLSPKVGIPVSTLVAIIALAQSRPISYNVTGIKSAKATTESSGAEAAYRAGYVLSASRRIEAASPADRPAALAREKKYFDQHLHATRNRRDSAAQVDNAAHKHGDQLGWYAKMDSVTSAECRAAHGKNFTVGKKPAIGYPGSVHPHCRCKAGKPHATSATVYNIKPDRKAA